MGLFSKIGNSIKDTFSGGNTMETLGAIGLGMQGAGMLASLFGPSETRLAQRQTNMQLNAQKELFDYQNAYNTPAKQMERLKEAGLNPNLMYGSISSGNGSGIGSVSSASINQDNRVSKSLEKMSSLLMSLDLQNKQLANESIRLDNDTKRYELDKDKYFSTKLLNSQRLFYEIELLKRDLSRPFKNNTLNDLKTGYDITKSYFQRKYNEAKNKFPWAYDVNYDSF